MKRLVCLLTVLSVVMGASLVASAFSLDGDASYLFGLGKEAKGQGFAANAKVEVFDNIFADAAFSFINFKNEDKGETRADTFLTIGGLYRVASEEDLEVFVGGGYGMLSFTATGPENDEEVEELDAEPSNDNKGSGFYGKFGFKFVPAEKFTLLADVSYAPKFKFGEEDAKSLLSARATVAYEVMENISVQGTIKHYRSGDDINSGILVGGGVSFTF